jgi:AraC-like DNA-binding protein
MYTQRKYLQEVFIVVKKKLQLSKLVIGERFISTALQYQLTLQQDYFYIVIPKNNVEVYLNGHKTSANQLLLFTENQEMLIRTSGNSCHYYIFISTDKLREYIDGEMINKLKKTIALQNVGINIFIQSVSDQKYLCSLVEKLLNQSALLNYQAVLDIQESIIESLRKLLTLAPARIKIKNTNMPTRLATVNRALRHIHKHSSMNITIPDLAEASFCCARSLEYAFKSILSMSPKQYLIKRRLQLIHSILQNQSNISISEITEKFGIVNQGRFAQDYFKFYKEYPHETRGRISRLKSTVNI